MTNYIPIAGTFAWSDDSVIPSEENKPFLINKVDKPKVRWWQGGSQFNDYMNGNNFHMYKSFDPFVWSTNLNGIEFWRRWGFLQRFFNRDADQRDWIAAGSALRYYIGNLLDVSDRNFIAHSHAYQVIAHACKQGLAINNLITVCSPIRPDMMDVYRIARTRVKKHLHIFDGGRFSDLVQMAGEFGAGSFKTIRSCEFADYNDDLTKEKIKHSKVLSDPSDFHFWFERGWLNFLKTGELKI